MNPVERGEIRNPVVNLASIQLHFGGQLVDGHWAVQCLEDFEPRWYLFVSSRMLDSIGVVTPYRSST